VPAEENPHAQGDGRIQLADGATYYPVVLRTSDEQGDELVLGIAALSMQPPRPPQIAWRLIQTLSEHLMNARDANASAAEQTLA
jgi:hypothetical protein